MKNILVIMYFTSAFIVLWAMVGYPISVQLLDKIFKPKKHSKNFLLQPELSIIIVAHNEEKVIFEKLTNVTNLDYPIDKIEIIVASDFSTDGTNDIVRDFIRKNPTVNIRLHETKTRRGKTNAQNEAQISVKNEFLIMTDANSILDRNSVKELMASFTSDDVAYVTGRLSYVNAHSSDICEAESRYWSKDLVIREIESRFQTITAGNGAIYACRNKDYYHFNPIQSHDSSMPIYFALIGKRAIANHDAIAYEKSGILFEDEFKRKVRMNRVLLYHIMPDFRILNFVKYKWFTYFYFGHRTCRYLLWIAHLILLLVNVFLVRFSVFYLLTFIFQFMFFLLAFIEFFLSTKHKWLNLIFYYNSTVFAQWKAVYNTIFGLSKPFWERTENMR